MTTTDKISYAATATIACSLASLASSTTTAARGGAVVDNTANLYDDAALTIAVKTSASALGANPVCYVYIYGATGDLSTYGASSAEAVGTDIAVTLDSPTNLKGPFVLACAASSVTYRLTVGSIASLFGGVMPQKWGFVFQNSTGQALDATEGNHLKTYSGISYTNG